MPTTGHCLCGDLAYEFDGAPNWVSYCHCDSCRRHTSSAVAAFVGLDVSRTRYTKGTPVRYVSSPGVTRSFCGRCGSPMSYEGKNFPGEVHFYIGTLSDPAALAPTVHVHVAEKLPWFDTRDVLPRHAHSDNSTESRDS